MALSPPPAPLRLSDPRAARARSKALLALVCVGCAPAAPLAEPPWTLSSEEGRPLDESSANPRLTLSGLSGLELSDVWLVKGEITKTSARRLARRDPPATVSNRRVPLTSWREGERVVLAPAVFLEPGETYSLAALGWGDLGRVVVTSEPEPRLLRVGSGPSRAGEWVSYCTAPEAWLDEHPGLTEGSPSGRLSPTSSGWEWRLGLAGTELLRERCVSFREPPDPSREMTIPPAAWGAWLLEPTPWIAPAPIDGASAEEEGEGSLCAQGGLTECVVARAAALEIELPVGFFGIEARLVEAAGSRERRARSDQDGVGAAEGEARPDRSRLAWWGAKSSPGIVALGPLEPDSEYVVRVARVGPTSVSEEVALVWSGPPQGRPVLNEVLANPRGPEPASEWIEIVNVGSAAARLSGFRLLDAGGETVLPDVTLAPGEFGLVVREDFRADPALDVVPAPTAVPIRVAQIGKSGLANGGEALRLLDPSGKMVSSTPPLEAREGKSLSRVDPWAPDTRESFVEHGGPGASPGAPNSW